MTIWQLHQHAPMQDLTPGHRPVVEEAGQTALFRLVARTEARQCPATLVSREAGPVVQGAADAVGGYIDGPFVETDGRPAAALGILELPGRYRRRNNVVAELGDLLAARARFRPRGYGLANDHLVRHRIDGDGKGCVNIGRAVCGGAVVVDERAAERERGAEFLPDFALRLSQLRRERLGSAVWSETAREVGAEVVQDELGVLAGDSRPEFFDETRERLVLRGLVDGRQTVQEHLAGVAAPRVMASSAPAVMNKRMAIFLEGRAGASARTAIRAIGGVKSCISAS